MPYKLRPPEPWLRPGDVVVSPRDVPYVVADVRQNIATLKRQDCAAHCKVEISIAHLQHFNYQKIRRHPR